jgi:ParB/RepB/Spo0J family partition protein
MEENQNELSLFPTELPSGESKKIKLDEIKIISSIPPSREFIASVSKWGVLVPISVVMLQKIKDGKRYMIIDGRRRVRALELVNLEFSEPGDFNVKEIDAVIYPKSFASMSNASSIMLNVQRGANAISEFQCIQRLIKEGYLHDQISEATGLKKSTIQKRMQLANLTDKLLDGAIRGKIAKSTAERIARLPGEYHLAIEKILEDNGRVTGVDIKEITRVRVEDAAEEIDDLMPDDDELVVADRMDEVDPWQNERAKVLQVVRFMCDHLYDNSEEEWDDNDMLDDVLREHILPVIVNQ